MKVTVVMPEVSSCQVGGCAYNFEERCHARGITVGGLKDHHCDTMYKCKAMITREDPAGVGACKVMDCRFNDGCECQADSIEVGVSGGSADCLTFKLL